MRSLAVLLLLAACGQPQAPPGDRIPCRPAGAAAFERACLLDRDRGADGTVLTVRHPDGAFRRLLVTKDGRGVAAADGMEQARVAVSAGNEIEIAIGGDRYRLPATLKGKPPSKP